MSRRKNPEQFGGKIRSVSEWVRILGLREFSNIVEFGEVDGNLNPHSLYIEETDIDDVLRRIGGLNPWLTMTSKSAEGGWGGDIDGIEVNFVASPEDWKHIFVGLW